MNNVIKFVKEYGELKYDSSLKTYSFLNYNNSLVTTIILKDNTLLINDSINIQLSTDKKENYSLVIDTLLKNNISIESKGFLLENGISIVEVDTFKRMILYILGFNIFQLLNEEEKRYISNSKKATIKKVNSLNDRLIRIEENLLKVKGIEDITFNVIRDKNNKDISIKVKNDFKEQTIIEEDFNLNILKEKLKNKYFNSRESLNIKKLLLSKDEIESKVINKKDIFNLKLRLEYYFNNLSIEETDSYKRKILYNKINKNYKNIKNYINKIK